MTTADYAIVDVFTDVPLEGNPLAVFADASGLSEELMQRVARELNLSETAFVLPGETAFDTRVRIFTPRTELPFAGHPVLGAAFVVGERSSRDVVRIETRAGAVPVSLRREEGRVTFGEMEQPLPSLEAFEARDELMRVLGVERSLLPIDAYRNGPTHLFVALEDDATVAALEPDLGALARLGALGVSCFACDGRRVHTRVFCPGLGVPEDPATGSAAGPLALHLARHGITEFGERLEIHQGAEIGRRSVLYATAEGSADRPTRIVVAGAAVIVARGSYRLA